MLPVVSGMIMFIIISVASFIAIAGVALIALGSSGAFSSKDPYTTATTGTTTISTNSTSVTVPTALLNNATLYPSGSSSANLSSFGSLSGPLSITTVNSSIISGIEGIDNSSLVFEDGRTQYLYFLLLNSVYNSTNNLFSTQITNNANNVSNTSTANVTGIIIRFDTTNSSSSGVLIPLTNIPSGINQKSTNGLSVYNTASGVVIQILLSVPTGLCPSANSQPITGCNSLTYKAYAVVNSTSITSSPSQSTVSLACGNVCSLSNSACSGSCTTCGTQQSSSNVTIATRRYIMNSTAGTFQLNYNTNSPQRQQIKVYNGGSLLSNLKCITAPSVNNLTYNSTSSLIRVDIEPDFTCSNTVNSGPWSFTVGCLIP